MSKETKINKSELHDLDQEFSDFMHTQVPEVEPDNDSVIQILPLPPGTPANTDDYFPETDNTVQWPEVLVSMAQADLFGEPIPEPKQAYYPPPVITAEHIIEIRKLTGKARKNADKALKEAAIRFLQEAPEECIWIPGNVSSSKNSKTIGFFWNKNPLTGRNEKVNTLVDSKLTTEYKRATAGDFLSNKVKFLNKTRHLPLPVTVEFTFIRDSLRAFDFINACQVLADLMKANGWVPDDDTCHLHPVFNRNVYYNADIPGVLMRIIL